MTNIWVECLKNKFRFEFKGLISTEDLFDLTLADLDAIYKSLKKEESDLQGDSLLGNDENPKVREVEVKIEVVKAVFVEADFHPSMNLYVHIPSAGITS